MQRIDENTYIDDTLVTCAEYQLFIDEMREQGKYYQPDHWTSYQFPEGQAREPVLGVRSSDAAVFCEWLTERENQTWNFRLPLRIETVNCQIKLFSQAVGYWIIDDKQYHYLWVGNMPSNARGLKPEDVLDYADHINLYAPLNRIFFHNNDRNKKSTIFQTLHRGIDHGHKFTDTIYSVLNHAVDLDFDRVQTDISNISDVPNFVFLLALENTLRKRVNIYANENDVKNIFYKIFIDLFTLQERIAGRSPAFEGIRLVKERIR